MKTHLILAMALVLLTGFLSAQDNKASVQLTAAIYEEEVSGNLDKAVELYLNILKKYPDDRPMAAKTLYHLGLVNEKMGQKKANEYFRRLVNTYPDQTEMVALAKAKLTALGNSGDIGRTEVAMRRIWDAGKDRPHGISPDGRYVVFTKLSPLFLGDLWLRDLQTGEQKRITNEASVSGWKFATGSAVISRDSRQIAYVWQVGSIQELRLSALDGSSMQVLHNGQDGKNMTPTAWMPDGNQILAISYDRKDRSRQWHIIPLPDDTIRYTSLSKPGYRDWGYPSPDGRKIAYGLNGDIFTYDIATKQDLILVQNPAYDRMIGWIPDGSGILFMSNRSGTDGLYLLATGNGQPRREPELLRLNLGSTANFYLTRDGRLFRIENTGSSDSFIATVDEKTGKLSGTPLLVDPNYPGATFPAWSTDGSLLYYSIIKGSYDDRSRVLIIRSEATGETREITPRPDLNWYLPILSPDGSRFAVSGSDYNSNFGLFEIDLKSSYMSLLVKIPTDNTPIDPCPNWSPDGTTIYYKLRSPDDNDEYIIRRKDLITGEEKEIFRGFNKRDIKLSPDGTKFAYFTNDKPTKSYILGILDIQSGSKLELLHLLETECLGISTPTWTPDGKYVLMTKDVNKASELWRFPVMGGPGEKLYFSPDKSWGFVMHPSGKRMAFMQSKINYELWALENFLPKHK